MSELVAFVGTFEDRSGSFYDMCVVAYAVTVTMSTAWKSDAAKQGCTQHLQWTGCSTQL